MFVSNGDPDIEKFVLMLRIRIRIVNSSNAMPAPAR